MLDDWYICECSYERITAANKIIALRIAFFSGAIFNLTKYAKLKMINHAWASMKEFAKYDHFRDTSCGN